MASTVIKSQSRFGTWLKHRCAANKSVATVQFYHINTGLFQHLFESMQQSIKREKKQVQPSSAIESPPSGQ